MHFLVPTTTTSRAHPCATHAQLLHGPLAQPSCTTNSDCVSHLSFNRCSQRFAEMNRKSLLRFLRFQIEGFNIQLSRVVLLCVSAQSASGLPIESRLSGESDLKLAQTVFDQHAEDGLFGEVDEQDEERLMPVENLGLAFQMVLNGSRVSFL